MDLIGAAPAVGVSRAQPFSIWAVSDGRAGIEAQALGLAEALARRVEAVVAVKRVELRSPWRWLHPGFTPAPLQAMTIGSDPLRPPWPDVWIGCGRQSVPFSMAVRGWSHERTLVVQLQDPRVNPREFDLVVPPAHDGLEGGNVWPTLGACHRITPARIAAESDAAGLDFAGFSPPRIGVLIGGKSKRQTISAARAKALCEALIRLKTQAGGSLLVSLSRRTPKAAASIFEAALRPASALFYAGGPGNPYFSLLQAADVLMVTEDSVNMAAEAAATGKPVFVLPVDGDAGKLAAFHQGLYERGCARPFLGDLEHWTYEPLLEADRIARRIVELLAAREKRRAR